MPDQVQQTIERDTFQDLLAVLHLAEVMNNRQHAGMPITPTMWAQMYQLTNAARGSLHKEAEKLLAA